MELNVSLVCPTLVPEHWLQIYDAGALSLGIGERGEVGEDGALTLGRCRMVDQLVRMKWQLRELVYCSGACWLRAENEVAEEKRR